MEHYIHLNANNKTEVIQIISSIDSPIFFVVHKFTQEMDKSILEILKSKNTFICVDVIYRNRVFYYVFAPLNQSIEVMPEPKKEIPEIKNTNVEEFLKNLTDTQLSAVLNNLSNEYILTSISFDMGINWDLLGGSYGERVRKLIRDCYLHDRSMELKQRLYNKIPKAFEFYM